MNGFLESDPALVPIAEAHLNATGRAALKDLSTMCVGDALLGYNSASSTDWTTDGRSLSDIIESEPALKAFLADQRIGTLRPTSPVRVATGTADDLVPHAQARALAVAWCAKGADVTYKPLMLPGLGSSLINHFTPLIADQGDAISWLSDRLHGRPATSNCATLPFRP